MKSSICTLMALLALSIPAFSLDVPKTTNIEIGVGYAHVTGNQGMNGFNADVAAFFSRRVAVAFDYDGVYNTSVLGAFTGTSLGQVVSKAHQQDFVAGPRIYLPGVIKSKNKDVRQLNPFGELAFGESHLGSSVRNAVIPLNLTSSDTSFAWLLGGGADYKISSHWVARVKVDLLRTHFVDAGQSHLRLELGVAYNLKPRRF
jgi:opacity protein-like surface antigen